MKCPNCGTQNPKKENFCVKCGASLSLPAVTWVLPSTPTALSNKTFYFVILLIILICVIVVIAIFSQGGQQPQHLVPPPLPPELPEQLEMTVDNILAGHPVICNSIIMGDDEEGLAMQFKIKMEYPRARMETTMEVEMLGQPRTLDILVIKEFGGKMYAHNLFGYRGGWLEIPPDDDLDVPPPEELVDGYGEYECEFVPDIPDSELVLPPGAKPASYSDPDIEYLDELDLLPSPVTRDAVMQGYSVVCKSEDIKEGTNRNHYLYFEAPRFAVENWEDDYRWMIYDGDSWYKNYRVASGGRKWFDITDDPDEIKVTYDQVYDNYFKKYDAGEISLKCHIIDDIDDGTFLSA